MTGNEGTDAYESPSIAEMLKRGTGDIPAPAPSVPEPQVKAETPEPVVEAEAKVTPEAQAAEVETETPVEPDADKSEKKVPLSAALKERERRKAAEAQLRETQSLLETLRAQQVVPVTPKAPPQAQPEAEVPWNPEPEAPAPEEHPMQSAFRLTASEELARLKYPDYAEKYEAFQKWVLEAPQARAQVFQAITASVSPAEAAYTAGQKILEAYKYGGFDVVSDPKKYREAISKELRTELEKEYDAKYKTKIATRIADRSKTPTDISGARAGGGSDSAEYRSPSIDEALRSVRKRHR